MIRNIGYHTRLVENSTIKCASGSFGGTLDLDTANRLVKSRFKVVIKPSGRPVFVDREGREAYLYFSIAPQYTEAGKAALSQHRVELAKQEEINKEKYLEVEKLLDDLSIDEVLARLRGTD